MVSNAVSSNLSHFAYILKCSDGTFYTGYTNDLVKRLDVHNQGKGAKYTRVRLPVSLVASWSFETKSEAMKKEYFIKTLTRQAKEALIRDCAI